MTIQEFEKLTGIRPNAIYFEKVIHPEYMAAGDDVDKRRSASGGNETVGCIVCSSQWKTHASKWSRNWASASRAKISRFRHSRRTLIGTLRKQPNIGRN